MRFDYSEKQIKRLAATLSSERLAKYAQRMGDDARAGIKLYIANTTLCESFYTPLQGLEVAVRNALHHALVSGFGVEWYDDSRLILEPGHQGMVKTAKKTIRERRKPLSPGRMVVELGFGFWTGILGPKYETTLWRPQLRHAFPHRHQGAERHEVHSAINRIRRLRNRVAHHEPIVQRNLPEDHEIIIRTIGWICPMTAEWINQQSRFPRVWATVFDRL